MSLRPFLRFTLRLVVATAASLCFFVPSSAIAEESEVKGPTVAQVTYKGPARILKFIQTGKREWKVGNRVYAELERDEWSVYLVCAKREADERVQIDVYTKQVTFSGKSGEKIFPITSASNEAPK